MYQNELKNYMEFIKILLKASQNFKTFVFIHKMDQLIVREKAPVYLLYFKYILILFKVFELRSNQIQELSKELNIIKFYATSIWDETFYDVDD